MNNSNKSLCQNTRCTSAKSRQASVKTKCSITDFSPSRRNRKNDSSGISSLTKENRWKFDVPSDFFLTKEKKMTVNNRDYKVVLHDKNKDDGNVKKSQTDQPVENTFWNSLKSILELPCTIRDTLKSISESDVSEPKKQCTCQGPPLLPITFGIEGKGNIIVYPEKEALHASKATATVSDRKYKAVINLTDYKSTCRDVCSRPQKSYCEQKRMSLCKYELRRKAFEKTGKQANYCPSINKMDFDDEGAGADSIPGFSFKLTKCQLDVDETGNLVDEECLIRDKEEERFLKLGCGLQPPILIMNEQSSTPLRIYDVSPSRLTRYISVC